MTLHRKHADWLLARGLDPKLAEEYGLASVEKGKGVWLSIPYREAGEVVNHKYRLTSEKQHQMDAGAPLSLWNADCLSDPKVLSGQAPVVITEGEWDAMAAIQAGFLYAVSVPNGAPAQETANLDTASRYDWVDRHSRALSAVKEFVIAADNDSAGYNLRNDLVRLLGPDRCKFIDYPAECKDLNEVLKAHGPEQVVGCISTAKAVPIQGLFRPSDFPERGEVHSFDVGIDALRDNIRIVPGTLTVVTGFANMGKTSMMDAIIGNAIRSHFPVCVASFETDVKPIMIDGLRCAILHCGSHELRTAYLSEVDELIEDRLTIISQAVDAELEMDLDQFLSLARVAVVRHGAKMVVLDPWNELEHKRRRDESETEYIGRAIRAIKRFAKLNDVAFWLVAHPTKPHEGSRKMPGLYDISGSANWANKADYGLTYHRTDFNSNRATICVSKVRKGLPGKRGQVDVAFDFRTSEFVSIEQ